MSTTAAAGQAPTSDAHPGGRHDRLGGARLAAVVVALTVAVGLMLLAFAVPAVNSGAHGLPLAVSGPPPAITQLTGALEQHHPGAFEFTSYATKDAAAQAIRDREAIGGIALGAGGTTIQTAAGAGTFPHVVADSLVAMLEVSAKMVGPVYAGDTVYPMLEITELVPQRTTGVMTMRATVHNQRNELVLEGQHRYLLRKRPST